MKITKKQLTRIIKEEKARLLREQEETKVELAPITVIDDQSLEEEIKTTILAAWQAAL